MGAVPNLFDFVIAEAFEKPDATSESVAAAIAASDPFLKAIRLGFADITEGQDVPTPAQIIRLKLMKAFSAATAGTMF
jgi:hypothetical protein